MPRANEIKKRYGTELQRQAADCKDIDIQSPSARGAATLYKMRFLMCVPV